MSKWKCARCGGTDKPNPVPGLCNRSMVTVAEFCSDKCRDEYLDHPHAKRIEIEPDMAVTILDDTLWGLEQMLERGVQLNAWETALYRRLKAYEVKPCKEPA